MHLNKNSINRSKNAQDEAFESIYKLSEVDFQAVNKLIPEQLTSDVTLVEEIGQHIVQSGGKRLRPLIVLLVARCCGYSGKDHILLAAIIEFLHTATLLHDDVVDKSSLRRGKSTANAIWGNSPSVLVGDFLYSRAFQLMVDIGDMRIMEILSNATNIIAEGEVLQLSNIGNWDITEKQYMKVIHCKTAMLFEAAAHTSAILSTEREHMINSFKDFGIEFGKAYQLIDDWLDYAGDSETMGKNIGDDLAEGKLTLPLIFALREGAADRKLIKKAVAEPSKANIENVIHMINETKALDYTAATAIKFSEKAMEALRKQPKNPYKTALENLTQACIDRVS